MGTTRLYVGGLPWSMEDAELKTMFEEVCGESTVEEARVIRDRETGKSRGFGFVKMKSVEKANEAIDLFKGKQHGGREIRVDEAKEPSGGGGNGGSRRGGGGHSGNYNNSGRSNYRGRRDSGYGDSY